MRLLTFEGLSKNPSSTLPLEEADQKAEENHGTELSCCFLEDNLQGERVYRSSA